MTDSTYQLSPERIKEIGGQISQWREGKYISTNDIRKAINQALKEAEPLIRKDEKGAIADSIPTNWCDPLLTGGDAVIGNPPYGCGDIENLLRAIAKQLREKE